MIKSMQPFVEWLNHFDKVLWNYFLIATLVATGIYFTIRLKGMQFKYLAYALKLAFTRSDDQAQGDISQFQALMTALAATIGIGSIAGVATAIMAGGFGAIFWMWLIALIGMATKYAEAILAVKYREKDVRGEMSGGPMYYIRNGLGWKGVAVSFAVCCILSAFCGGNLIQSNSIAQAASQLCGIPHYMTGIALTIITAVVLLGGIKSIGRLCSWLVPVMALMYVIGGIIILYLKIEHIPAAFLQIFQSAFSGQAACGGFLGASVTAAVQLGVARGVSSNEAGLGSAPIAAAAAKTDVPGRQALISMTGVFLSSLVVCSITALVIAVTGVFGSVNAEGALINGAPLVMNAFASVLPGGELIVAIGLILFGYSTVIGWAYYGEKCLDFLGLGKKVVLFRMLFSFAIYAGAVMSFDVVWPLADIMNGLMALPNLIGLLGLSSVVLIDSRAFFKLLKQEKALIN